MDAVLFRGSALYWLRCLPKHPLTGGEGGDKSGEWQYLALSGSPLGRQLAARYSNLTLGLSLALESTKAYLIITLREQ